jgi:capsular exopolysaccharide synthesis family protein
MKLIEPPRGHEFAPPAPLSPVPPGNQFDAPRMLRTVRHGLPIIIGAVLCGILLGYAALRALPTKYTSSAAILIDPKRPGALGSDGDFVNLYVDTAKIADVELILVSSALLRHVVQEQHLADDPWFGDAKPSLLRTLVPLLPASSSKPGNTPADREMRAVDQLARNIHTQRQGMTYVIKVDVSAPSPTQARRLAEAVADAYLNDQAFSKQEAARRDTAWLKDQIAEQRQALLTSERAVETIRQQYGLLATDTGTGPDTSVDRQSIDAVNAQLVQAEGDLAAAAAKYQQAQAVQLHGGNLGGLPDVAGDKVIEELRKDQAEANRRLGDLSRRYGPNFPGMREAEDSRNAINGQVALEIARVVDALRNDYETAMAHRDALKRQRSGLVGAVSAAGSAKGRVELREAERVAEANRLAYEASMNRLRDVEQQETRQDSEARIIGDPETPDAPSFPKPALCLAGGAGVGLLVGLGLIFLFPYHRHRVVDIAATEQALSLPVLAMTPLLPKAALRAGSAKMTIPEYLASKPFSRFADSLRVLRLHLRAPAEAGGQVIQITSAVPGEGKSTISAGLAISAAAAGMRTVIVDLDFHNPTIGRLFGGEQAHGVVDVLLGNATAGATLRAHATLPLRIIDAGTSGRPRPDLFEGANLRELVRELRKQCDLVVLDTPPVLAISDPLFIAGIVDATVMVVAWHDTPQRCVDDALAALRSAHAPVAGLALNKVNLTRAGRYGVRNYAYDGYGAA